MISLFVETYKYGEVELIRDGNVLAILNSQGNYMGYIEPQLVMNVPRAVLEDNVEDAIEDYLENA